VYSVQNIGVSFGGEPLFKNGTFIINPRERIGLVGKNGSGKTTLLRLIAGYRKPDEGEVVIPGGKTIGYLAQEMSVQNTRSVIDEAYTAFHEIKEIEAHIHTISEQLTHREDYHSTSYHKLVDDLTELNEKHRILGGQTAGEDIEKILSGLGYNRDDLTRPLNQFSYGWQIRVEIAKILLKKPDLLLLDEPTNHLDIDSIEWLESFLKDYPGAIMLVSHDRAFLDNVTNRTIEIEFGRFYDYKVPYSEYIEQRENRLENQVAAYNNQQRQIRQIQRFIERFRYKNTKSRQVQSRIKMLEKMDEIEIDDFDSAAIHFQFPLAPPSGKVVVEAEHLVKRYDEKLVLDNLDFVITKGERVAFVGRNGEGKTTLSKIIAGILDAEGMCRTGYNVSIGYYAQNPNEMLDPDITVFDTIDKVAVGDIRSKIRTLLGGFLFGEEEIDKKVKVLSGGEKSRLALAKLLLTPANLLVLDEPTNHLDMQSKDILKNALLKFEGTLVVVSHDRDFLQGLTNKVFEFANKNILEYIGDVYDFLETRKIKSLKELEYKEAGGKDKNGDGTSQNKQVYEKRRELDREIRKLTNKVQKCEKEIETVEKEIGKLDQVFADPAAMASDQEGKHFREYDKLKSRLVVLMAEWEQMNLQLEKYREERSSLIESD
jgi:ATP-binding cassette subfamily F protein 3